MGQILASPLKVISVTLDHAFAKGQLVILRVHLVETAIIYRVLGRDPLHQRDQSLSQLGKEGAYLFYFHPPVGKGD